VTLESTLVSVAIVTHNSESCLARCLESLLAQDWPALEIVIVDNASTDGTRRILRQYEGGVRVILNDSNRGFAGGQNQAIAATHGEWVLALNPDARLMPDFISRLMQAGAVDSRIGTVCGKLLRALPGLAIPARAEIDSAGIYFTPSFRHFDRGLHQPDGSDYSRPAFVFGATGAAALYRRAMIDDISIEGEFFDEDFFFSREDADVAWRAQLMGWKCLYVPAAVGYHVRRVFPEARKSLPAAINQHGVKNRFLMRIKNASTRLYLRNFLPVTLRDLCIVGYCLVRERTSLSAFGFIARNWNRALQKRRIIQRRRRVPDAYIRRWFRYHPVTVPADIDVAERVSFEAAVAPQGVDAPGPRAPRAIFPLPNTRPETSRLP